VGEIEPSVLSKVPLAAGITEKWMTWVMVEKSMLDAGMLVCSQPG
jgi:hypothetical protein